MSHKAHIPIGPYHPLQEEPEFYKLVVDGETVVVVADEVVLPAVVVAAVVVAMTKSRWVREAPDFMIACGEQGRNSLKRFAAPRRVGDRPV